MSFNEMGTWRSQLKAMLRKNWLLKTRRPFVTSAEVPLFSLFTFDVTVLFTDRPQSELFLGLLLFLLN